MLKDVRRPPGLPAHQRGVASLRGEVMPAVDLRACLGQPSAEQELAGLLQLLRDREQDHLDAADDPLAGGALQVDLVPRLARWSGATQPVLVLDLERVAALGTG